MASLELNLDGTFGDDDGKMGESCHQYKDDKEYQILKEFLQLDSHTPLEAAVNSLLELIPDHGSSGSVQSNIDLCAGVIPWHHPSHLKLAYLAERLRWSPKMSPQLGNIKVGKVPVCFQPYDADHVHRVRKIPTCSTLVSQTDTGTNTRPPVGYVCSFPLITSVGADVIPSAVRPRDPI